MVLACEMVEDSENVSVYIKGCESGSETYLPDFEYCQAGSFLIKLFFQTVVDFSTKLSAIT